MPSLFSHFSTNIHVSKKKKKISGVSKWDDHSIVKVGRVGEMRIGI